MTFVEGSKKPVRLPPKPRTSFSKNIEMFFLILLKNGREAYL